MSAIELMKANAAGNAFSSLREAVAIMQQAVDHAGRSIADLSEKDLDTACQRVLHDLTWGFANASSALESAMHSTERYHQAALIEAKEGNHAG